ncbi:hypothetical protein HYT55_05465 [Candidatus Woesearchaeota archaeon]|nr:hypothetical protein [Candidatus Woesearchaeota archaeon]
MTTVLFSESKQIHSIGHSLYHAYASSVKTKRKELRHKLCPQCNHQMNKRSDNILGINFDGSYYIKRAITIHLCNQCNYLQR